MKINEKTYELNFCAQLYRRLSGRAHFFGLTQAQESQYAFDVATAWNGRLTIFQFKVGHRNQDDTLRYSAKHDQMQRLVNLTQERGMVFYALPLFVDSTEIRGNDILNRSIWIDVRDLPNPIPPPISDRTNRIRSNRSHYFYFKDWVLTMKTDPVKVNYLSPATIFDTSDFKLGIEINKLSKEKFLNLASNFKRNAIGVVIG